MNLKPKLLKFGAGEAEPNWNHNFYEVLNPIRNYIEQIILEQKHGEVTFVK